MRVPTCGDQVAVSAVGCISNLQRSIFGEGGITFKVSDLGIGSQYISIFTLAHFSNEAILLTANRFPIQIALLGMDTFEWMMTGIMPGFSGSDEGL